MITAVSSYIRPLSCGWSGGGKNRWLGSYSQKGTIQPERAVHMPRNFEWIGFAACQIFPFKSIGTLEPKLVAVAAHKSHYKSLFGKKEVARMHSKCHTETA